MKTDLIYALAVVSWGLSEFIMALFKRAGSGADCRGDRGSLPLLVVVLTGCATLGLLWDYCPLANMPWDRESIVNVALCLFAVGIALRWIAILTLGKYFTTNVAVLSGHRVVEDGVYAVLRHPSYTGTLLILAGIGAGTANWIGSLLVFLPGLFAILHRIKIEERLLLCSLGREYEEYRKTTWRLVPRVY